MSRQKNKNSAGSTTQPRESRPSISLTTARKMLPLVSRIVQDIQERWQHLSQLEDEQADLDRRRRELAWPERSRRYQVTEEIKFEQNSLQLAVAELENLEILLVDAIHGEVAFPTTLNGRKGYFIWRSGANDIGWWCYTHDPTRHAIPASWKA